MRWGRVVSASFVLAPAAALAACGYVIESTNDPPASADAAVAADAGSDAPPCTQKSENDLEGCACAVDAPIRQCAHGKTGDASACTLGTQRCTSGRWTECAGASSPGAEVCFDAIDQNCDGRLDDGCYGSGDVDMCKDQTGKELDPSLAYAFTDKPTYKSNETVILFAIAKAKIDRVEVGRVNPGSYCAGLANGAKDVDPGRGCAGWFAKRVDLRASDTLFSTQNATTLQVYLNGPPSDPCNGGKATTAKASVTVTN